MGWDGKGWDDPLWTSLPRVVFKMRLRSREDKIEGGQDSRTGLVRVRMSESENEKN